MGNKVKTYLKRGVFTITIILSLLLPMIVGDVEFPTVEPTIEPTIEPTMEPTTEVPYDVNTTYEVLRVIDGDTFKVIYKDQERSVRLIGVDTPETVHPRKPVEYYGKEASDYTKKILEGQKVYLEFDVEEYDYFKRPLVYVYLSNGDMLNALLVQEGYAYAKKYPPNVKYSDLFENAQERAKEEGIGIWNNEQRTIFEKAQEP